MDTKKDVKVIKMILDEGNLDGVSSLTDDAWRESGEMYSAPREYVDNLLKKNEINKYGVYLLISNNKVYVGQSSDLSKRIQQHKLGKDWWNRVIVLTTRDNSFSKTDIDYLENVLIEEAFINGTLDSDNKKKGNPLQIDKYRIPTLNKYLEEAYFLLELIGINIFKKKTKENKETKLKVEGSVPTIKKQGNIRKNEVIDFLLDKKYELCKKNVTYASLQETKNHYWANPKVDLLEKDWCVILNNQLKREISILKIPAHYFTYSIDPQSKKFRVRKDRSNQLDIEIDCNTYIEKRSKINLKSFLIGIEKY